MLAMRWELLWAMAAVLAGCLHGKSHPCTGNDGTSWVCPEDKACAAAPIYCGTSEEVGACDGKMDRDPCSTMLVQDGLCLSNVCEACSYDIAGCRYVGWNPMTSPTPELLNAIAFTDFGEAYAAGDHGTMLRYDIANWAADTRFPTADLASQSIVALTAATARVYALTNSMAVYVLDGGAWKPLPALGTTYKSMWVASTGDVFLGGALGRLARFDGTAWTEITMGGATTTYSAMWGTSVSDVYAAGFTGTTSTVLHYDGATWSAVAVPNAGQLAAIWGAGGEVFAAGTSILHATSGTFTLAAAPPITARSIWGSSPTDVFVVGDGGVILHWDGAAWTQMKVAFSTRLLAVSGSSATEVIAVGDGGTIERYTGAAWAVLPQISPAITRLRSVWAASPTEAFAAGNMSSSTIFHLQSGVWTPETIPAIGSALVSVWGRSPTDVYAIGQLAAAHRTTTTSWTDVSSSNIAAAVATWGDASSIYAVGNRVAKYDGATWTDATTLLLDLSGAWVDPTGTLWVAGNSGLGRLAGNAVAFDVTDARFSAIWGADAANVFAVGVGEIRHYDGSAWTKMTVPTTATLTGVWGRASDDVFAVGVGNTVLHYHAGLWKPFTTPFANDLTSVSGAGDAIYMTASDGSVYELLDTAP
jgi:hypothetical protein